MTTMECFRRRGYALLVAIVGFGIVSLFAFVLARYALLDAASERRAAFESCAQQVTESARAWSLLHTGELSGAGTVALPIDRLLPGGTTGRAELCRRAGAGGGAVVECRIRLVRGGQSLRRRLEWPLPGAPTTRPASAPATP